MSQFNGFDANDHKSREECRTIPAADYLAAIVEHVWKQAKSGKGRLLELTLEILDGEYKGRKIRDWLNLEHSDQTTVAIAKQALSEICRATNIMRPLDAQQFHRIPIGVTVACAKSKDTDEINNKIKKYFHKSELGKAKTTASPAETTSAASATGNDSTPPWERQSA
jgi:hypothetical protein